MGPEVWATGLLHRKEIIVAIVCCYRITISCVLCRSWRSSFFFSGVVSPPRKERSKPQYNAPNIYHRSPARRLRRQQRRRRRRRRLLHAGDERTMFNSYLDFVHSRALYVFFSSSLCLAVFCLFVCLLSNNAPTKAHRLLLHRGLNMIFRKWSSPVSFFSNPFFFFLLVHVH